MTNLTNRYWGDVTPPKSKAEFFNAVTTPTPAGDGKVATIRMYGPIDSWGGWWGISTKDVGAVLDALPESVDQIILRINSGGGEVFEAVSILNMLRAHKATVTAVVDGLAASAASVIAAGCDENVMSPGTQMMIHSPLVFSYGNASELRKVADVLDGIEGSLVEIYTAKAGEKDWAALLGDETWMTAKDAVELGLADRVAVIPDAGETETVGADPIIVTLVEEDDDVEDSAARLRPVAAAEFIAAHKLPVSTEPGDPNQKEALTMSDTIKAGLRERLGVTDADASDETLLAALDEALEEGAEPTPTIPEGAQLIDAGVLASLQSDAAAGREALAAQSSARREGVVAAAVTEGRIAPASRDKWLASLAKDEEGTTALIASLAPNTVPVDELGHQAELSEDDAFYDQLFGADEKEAHRG